MNHRTRFCRKRLNSRENIHWVSVLYTNMEDKSEGDNSNNLSDENNQLHATLNSEDDLFEDAEDETACQSLSFCTNVRNVSMNSKKQNSRIAQNLPRTFYNGQETADIATFQSLPYQKSRGHRSFKRSAARVRNSYGLYRSRGSFHQSKQRAAASRKPMPNHMTFSSDNSSSDAYENRKININKPSEYGLEFFPNSVNINQKKNLTSMRVSMKSCRENEKDEADCSDYEDRINIFLKAKENFFSMKSGISPSDIIMNYRHQIQKLSDNYIAKNFEKIEGMKYMIENEKAYASIFEIQCENLKLQQRQFDLYISRKRNECSDIQDNDVDSIILKADKIKMDVENECSLFERTLPAYAYKEELLSAFVKHEVIIVSSDSSYFFNTVLPVIVMNECHDYSVISCESNNMLCGRVKYEIESILKHVKNAEKLKIMNEDHMLNYLSDNVSSENTCFVLNLQLKRSVTVDLLLSLLQDFLPKQKHSRLFLLLSVFDDIKKYENYFVKFKVFTLEVPKLLLPVQTVWKREPSKNYKEDLVSTALAVHLLNDPGDVFAFLPSVADAKTAIAMFTTNIKELNYDIKCILLHENNCNALELDQLSNDEKRKIFFIPDNVAVMPLPSVRYVIDCGLTRDFIYDSVKNLDVLTTVFNSRAKSRLRKGLVGVYSNGICYRLYSKENFCTDMSSYERPDILTLNPFNTLLKIFDHQPQKALSVQFVEPINAALKYNTVKLLKNFGAVKNEKLTELGKKMVKLPFSARYSKLILQGIQWGFAYEAVILVAYLSLDLNVFIYSKNEDYLQKVDAAKLELSQSESDTLTFLYIYKCWIENKCQKFWCDKYHIEYETLNEVLSKVSEICSTVYECLNESIFQEFSEDDDSNSYITKMLFLCFADNLCVYSGHYRCGYRILSSRQTAFLHPSTVLCNKDSMPQLILFNKIIHTSRNFLSGITTVPTDLVLNSLAEKTLDYDYSDVFERSLVSGIIKPVSERIIKQVLLGRKGKKLQEIEDSMRKKLQSELIIIDPSPEKGCVYVYALQQLLDSAIKMVEEILKNDHEEIINAEKFYDLELTKGEVSVPLEVKCIMGAKIISVKIKDVSQKLNSFCGSHSADKKIVKDNISAVQYSINLTWVRRPCNGICYVNFTPNSFVLARKLAYRNITVLESEVCVEVSKMGEYQLILSDVPPEARASDIEEALRRWEKGICITKIQLIFKKPFETTLKDIEDIKMQIQENCEEYTNLVDFDIVVPKPKNTASIMTAYINVVGTEDLTKASEELSNTVIQNFRVTAIPVYRSVIKSSFKVYAALETRIQTQIEKLKCDLSKAFPKKDLFRFEAERVDKDSVSIKLLSNDIKIMKLLQKATHELLEGEILTKNLVSDIHKLFCHGGHMWLRTLEKSKKVYIIEDYKSKIIRVYGSQDSCFSVKESILKFLEDTENEAVETIILSSRILLKSIIKEYGVNLKIFVELCKLRSAVLDIKLCRLFLHGSRESIDQAKDILKMLSNNSDSVAEFSLLSSGEMCPVCACPPFNLTFRLQHCAHLYCRECILGLVEQAQFPVQCCAENCSEDIVLDDIVSILDEDEEKMKKLLHSSLDDFLEKHQSEIFYCPAPDCPMFTYKNSVSERWVCPLCQNDICTNCNVVYHIGFTCDLYQGSKRDPDYSFKVWKEGTSQCKECPKCKTAIEKNAGCDHMTCIICKAHFCWVCVREFPSRVAVYNHIPFCDKYPTW